MSKVPYFDYNPKPAFCPFTGKQCASVTIECLDGACGKYWDERNAPLQYGQAMMCLYHDTCLISICGDCCGSIEESESRECNAPFVIADIPEE